MKKTYLTLLIFLGLVSLSTYATPEVFTLDPTHSFVTWRINHFGFSHPSGKWSTQGKLTLDEENPKNSKVEATIQLANIITGVPKLDEHLKNADFFDIKKYPTATFVSKTIEAQGKSQAKVQGILTLHGVSKPVILYVTLNKIAESPITHKKTAGFSANTVLKRSGFGINNGLPGLSDEVEIQIDSEAVLG